MKPTRLSTRVFLLNAVIFVVATLALVITPATISFPVELTELVVLVFGLTAILGVNAFALRAAFAPLERLMRLMREVDPRRPTERLGVEGPDEVRGLAVVFNEMLDRLEHERRESTRGALAAQEGERRRVAQELHDEVGQVLTGILLRLESLARRVSPEGLPELRANQEATREAINSVSLITRRLRPEALADLGLGKALAALAERIADEAGIRVRVRVSAELGNLGEERELVIYRIAQESLTNAVRHASAREVDLTLERHGDVLVLCVRDDGSGFSGALTPNHGILGMRERAMLIGATLTVENRFGGGVEVTLRTADA